MPARPHIPLSGLVYPHPLADGIRKNVITNPSFEVDAAGWAPWGGSTVARSTGAFRSGSASLRVSDAAASLGCYWSGQTLPAQASPGETWTTSCYLKHDDTSGSMHLYLVWFNASYAQIGADYAGAVATTGYWQRLSSTATAPADTRYVAVVLADYGTGPNAWYCDDFLLERASAVGTFFNGDHGGAEWGGTAHASPSYSTVARRNLIPNPSFEVDTSGYVNDVGTVARSTAQSLMGDASALVTRTTAGSGASDVYHNIPGTGYPANAGEDYTFSCWVYPTVTRNFLIQVYCRDGAPAEINPRPQSAEFTCQANQWTKIEFDFTTPAGTEAFIPLVYGLNVAQNEVFYTDAWCMTRAAEAGPYFDGSQGGGWEGTAHNSVSFQSGLQVRASELVVPVGAPAGETRDGDAIAHLLEAKAVVLEAPLTDDFNRANENLDASANWAEYQPGAAGARMKVEDRRMTVDGVLNYGYAGWEGASLGIPAVAGLTLGYNSPEFDHYLGFISPADSNTTDLVALEVGWLMRDEWEPDGLMRINMYVYGRTGGVPDTFYSSHPFIYERLEGTLSSGDQIACSYDGEILRTWMCRGGIWETAGILHIEPDIAAVVNTYTLKPVVWLSNRGASPKPHAERFFYSVY